LGVFIIYRDWLLVYMLTRYKLLAQLIVDEMIIMRFNVFRLKGVHDMLGTNFKFLPITLEEFEDKIKYTHVLSARLLQCLSCLNS
jgi:hypothetical protein